MMQNHYGIFVGTFEYYDILGTEFIAVIWNANVSPFHSG